MEANDVKADQLIWGFGSDNDDTDIQQQWRKMFEDISNYVGDDPLLPWLRCVKWVRATFSHDTQNIYIKKLLETCTATFQNDDKYRNDIRYLKLWIFYADSSQDFDQVYSTMEEKGIGRFHSLFYEAYAIYLELQSKLVQANAIYLLGLSRQAQPYSRLKNMYAHFLDRMTELVTTTAREAQKCENLVDKGSCSPFKDSDICNKMVQISLPTSDVKSFKDGELRQTGSWKKRSSSHGMQPEYSTENIGGKRCEHELGDKLNKSTCSCASLVELDSEKKGSEETISIKLSKNRAQALSEAIIVENRQKKRRRSSFTDCRNSTSLNLGVTSEDEVLGDGGNAQPNNTMWPVVSSSPIGLSKNASDGHNNNVHPPTVEGIGVPDADVYKSEFRIRSSENPEDKLYSQESTNSVHLVNTKRDSDDEKEDCHLTILHPCSEVAANGFESLDKDLNENESENSSRNKGLNPWANNVICDLLKLLKKQMLMFNGYNASTKNYNGKACLSSLRNAARNKVLNLGGTKYHIKGCSGEGAFAQVYRAHIDGCTDDTVALKIQRPACPWEFYMYRQLDERILTDERSSFGSAWKVHLYSDCSILVCDYLEHGTLQDVINSYLVIGQCMDEVLCIYYTIEMLRMLETLHSVGLIHGDVKPDNLLIRYVSNDISDEWSPRRTGQWKNQGLCLIDWGRGIDMTLFPSGTEFKADSRTSGFRCIEMQENRPWTFQVDTYGLCSIVHMMLHGSYMELVKRTDPAGDCLYHPKAAFKRYWNGGLWKKLFMTLLNVKSCQENPDLSILRKEFEDHLSSSPQLKKKLKQLLMKQRTVMCLGR